MGWISEKLWGGGVNTIVPKVKSTGAWRPIEKYKRIDCVGVDEHGPHQWLGIQLHTDLRAGRAYSLDILQPCWGQTSNNPTSSDCIPYANEGTSEGFAPWFWHLVQYPISQVTLIPQKESEWGCIGEDEERKRSFKLSGYPGYRALPGRKLRPTVSKWKLQPTFQCQMSVSGPIWCQKRFAGKFPDWKNGRARHQIAHLAPLGCLVGWTSLGLGQLWAGVSGVHPPPRPDQALPVPPPSVCFDPRTHFKGAVICELRRWAQRSRTFLCSYANSVLDVRPAAHSFLRLVSAEKAWLKHPARYIAH